MNAIDASILSWINSLAGRSPELDRWISFAAFEDILKGGVFVPLLCYVWFRPGPGQTATRERLLLGLLATGAALAANRVLASLLPFRPRPVYDPDLPFPWRPLAGFHHRPFESLSSFPSDHAVLFIALGAILYIESRRLGIAALLYAALAVFLPRLYLGLHAPTDLLAGAALGLAFLAACLRMPALRPAARGLLAIERRRPQIFYPVAFLAAWMVTVLFQPLVDAAEFLKSYWTR